MSLALELVKVLTVVPARLADQEARLARLSILSLGTMQKPSQPIGCEGFFDDATLGKS